MSRVLAGSDLPPLSRVPIWLNDPSNWWGSTGMLVRIREHLTYTGLTLLIAILIAVPLGLYIGHTGRGKFLIAGSANALRAVPTLGLLVFLIVLISPHVRWRGEIVGVIPRGGLGYFLPVMIVLVVLAIPPILTNTYAGVESIDPSVRDAAKGMGMRGSQVVRKVEVPCALPLIMSGLRSATLQVIATATVAAYAPFLGGLGRPLVDGDLQLTNLQHGYPAMVSAGILVALLAVVVDGVLLLVERRVVSRGVSGRFRGQRRLRRARRLPELQNVDREAVAAPVAS